MLAKGHASGIETRGVSDHGFIHSIYFRDPNGYVIELTSKQPGHDAAMDPAQNRARAILDQWQASSSRPSS
jgi:catechol-2,3-dioxygenase